jgi:uncharacterized protein YpbB
MYKEGKSIREIAALRDLKETTIESHLAHYVGLGMLDLKTFVEEDKVKKITAEFEKQGMDSLNPVKEALGKDYSYGELRFVKEYLTNAKKEG